MSATITKMTNQERYRLYPTNDGQWQVWDHEDAEQIAKSPDFNDMRDLEQELRWS